MIHSPIVFLFMLFCLFYGCVKLNYYQMIMHPYLPKCYILIYRSATSLFTIFVHCYLPITRAISLKECRAIWVVSGLSISARDAIFLRYLFTSAVLAEI